MNRILYSMILTLLSETAIVVNAQQVKDAFPFRNTSLSPEERVNDIVSRMTLQEKADQLLYTAPAIPRLGVPEYNWWNEALHGVARAGYATVFPQSITIANSWDEGLMYSVANAISDEARAKYHEFQRRGKRGIYQGLTFWSPNINIFRDPRWGRGHETYGEDPFLTGRMGLQFVKGLQGDDPKYFKTVATAKHFAVHSGPEPLRHTFNALVSEVDLRETYLPAFRTLIVDGGTWSVMGAYNKFRGLPCTANPVLYGILRNEWGFKGYIVSDCWAVSDYWKFMNYTKDAAEAAALAVKAGTDIECGVDYKQLMTAFERGLLTEADIDIAVKRVFQARFKLGMFDPDDIVPYAQIPFFVNCSDFNNSLAREAARKSVVLLKNTDNTLPLKKEIKTIAVIGPNADNFESLIGNYNGIPKDPVTVLEGISGKVSPDTKLIYAEGSDLAEGVHNMIVIPSRYLQTPDGKQGVLGEYFNNREMTGTPAFTRTDDQINFYWEHLSPRYDLPDDDFGVKWTTYLTPPGTDTFYLGGWGSSGYEILVDGKSIIKYRGEHHAFHTEEALEMKAGERYKVEVFYKNYAGDADMKLLWARPRTGILEEAVKAAKDADAVVLVLGLSQRLEGEEMPIKIEGFSGGDRTNLNLPAVQEKLLDAISATGKPVIVVLANGGALSVNKAHEKASAIILAGYGGQQGGNAVADVLFGDYNPAGRLPVTYYKSIDQIPVFENYDMKGKTYRFFSQEPLYPFGYGLSYTTFSYSNLSFPQNVLAGEKVKISVTVTNTGKTEGDEVVQLYITDEKASTPRPIRQLEGFSRINLKPGESRVVDFTLEPRQFSIINNKEKRVIEPGYFTISVGGKQPGFSGYLDPKFTQVLTGRIRLTGKELAFDN
ncbi:MAG: glucan 1,4-alpha-glucosidase [Bacteroidetes bacterium GWE2_41_25]|nr:MAG: glucan 1,4-alpha-glucosidase [Bacteroidetes bacterium GWA2_40_15]OFX94544.1 MAG: glucan 1,4-alpha-glucosidase [Bacteroidetes bacterium GWE2_41_25]OFX96827.1 MAG: glucan 1,4-alpha-glucosidase [Bacteroidetes bacterium GWC2_40_22]HBH83996.1 glucan 1,4-alpha-glucosidase [Bacteroidales bacterium]HCU18091.1 glucan 1,4-alpha-glucosidase [Bacteroidales bacterium]